MSLIERAAERIAQEQRLAEASQAAPPVEPSAFDLGLSSEPVAISPAHLQEQGCLTPTESTSVLAQEYRRIKRPLLVNIRSRIQQRGQPFGANLLMVTSAMSGEGKSYVSANLALSIAAEIDQTVLLIDCDVAKRGAAKILGIDRLPGLLDVVVGERTVEEVLVKTDIKTLSFLPAGTSRPNADELFASDAMRELIEEMSSRYSDRVLIFDTPPVFATNVPTILVKMIGQLIFVIEADKSSQQLVEEALHNLQGCDQVGLVLNKASRRMPGHGYDYAYGYR